MDGEKQEDSNSRSAVTASSSASAAVTMATVCPGSSMCTRAPSSSLSIISPDRPAVQGIQHAIQRPQNLAAQLLQQMYAAQQQHLMLQTAALQQHSPHLQSLATIQASMCQRQSTSSSSNGLIHQPAGVSISLPASPVTAQLVGRTQNSISSGVSTTISQQHCLLGGRPTNCNQAQMYLRTQMLILTPAASVAPVQSDLPAVTSCSSASNASRGLVVHHLPGALATALTPAAPKTSVHSLKSSQVSENSSERGQSEVTGSQVLTPALHPAQTALKQQRFCPPGHQVAHCQLIPQQATGAALNPRQLQSVTASVSPQNTSSYPPPFLSKSQSSPAAQSQTARSAPASSSLTSASSAQTSVPAARVQPQLPPLMAAPQRRSSFPEVQSCPPPPPAPPPAPAPALALPRFPQNPPGALQRLLLHSVQALAVQSQQVVLKDQELSATEGLVQTPYQSLPPPQTEAVDLKVQPVPSSETPLPGQTCKGNSSSLSQKRDESPRLSSQSSPPFPGSLKQNGGVVDSSSNLSSHSMIRPLAAEEPSHLTTSNSSNGAPPSPTQPPHILHAAVRCPSHPPSSPSSPIGPLTTHVLTHLIEGFVIQEGLEPFPVVPSSLLKKKQASLPDSQEINTHQDAAREERPLEANQPDSSDSEMEYSGPAADVAEHGERAGGMLRCEYCGARGYARISLRSKRFCSMMCVRRFCKHITLLRAGRWGHRAAGRRGRPPSRVSGYPREHFLKQVYTSEKTREGREEEDEEEAPAPMTTRLRKRAERRREKATEQEREQERPIAETISISDEAEEDRCPSHWDVEQVFSFIKSLPGGEDVAEEFRSQEIDGQALLLLTEDHLVSTMNLKLGPALKLYAHINSLKDS